ncbi:PREDICTED: protein polybromo-1-like [Amphimedon queenslandica]|uniref:Protein polybromo-1 n=1 Tax=Amphimedon queenslandica TaxID=400682 RepID=A0A1X7VK56_AMPQE|nr:PREDICTED: protein polybromo-1-like [Amphimedon queenslandica]|eukprot:XP_019864490.1 PREDICTED: protein polybromo-1-like [Amphimedon queenslandica]
MKRRRQSSVESEDQQPGVLKKQKRRKESLISDPWGVPPELYSKTELCSKLYDALRSFKGPDNQPLCDFVVRLPNRRSIPEYYKVVTYPIDLLKIQQKLKTDEYDTVPLFISDIQLLIENAKLFYTPSSAEYKRACSLEKEFLKALQDISVYESDITSPLSPKTVSLKLSSLGKTPPASSACKSSSAKPSSGSAPTSSKRLSNAGKTTRSKAWLDDYLSSDDPIKIYFADIYSYHDSNGDYISQPFIDLPSAKEYPEYYRIITEPIGLAMIKSNIESGHYRNLKEIQEDLLLMIKNAQYFNEPLSDIHKMATTLRKVIINRCIELERKYKTVERTTKLQSPKIIKSMDDSESEDSSCSDSDAPESEDSKKRLLLHIKRDSLQLSEDPFSKILKSKSPPSLKKVLLALYRKITRATDKEGRVMSELFMKRPSAKLYPEYYIVIKTPIDFKEIYRKIKKDIYKTFSEMMDDVDLLVNNAITFNEEYSQIHTDALALKAIAKTAADQLQANWPLHFATGDKKVEAGLTNRVGTLFAVVKNCIDSTGRKLWLSLKDPPQFSKGEGEGHSGSRKVIGLGTVSERVDNNSYGSVHEVFGDLCLVYDSYCESVPSHSTLFKDALSLHRITVTKYNELTDEQRNKYQYPNAPELLKKLLKDLMAALMEAQDTEGHTISEVLQSVTATLDYSDDGKSKRILSLEKVNHWISLGRYTRLDQLQKDLLLLFQQARQIEAEMDNEVDKIIISLEKEYVKTRDRICSSFLWSPAYEERTIKHIDDEEQEEDCRYDCKQDDQMDSSAQTTLIPPLNERTIQKFLLLGEITYFPGDFVYLPPREQHLPPQIALIESLWTDSQGIPWFDGCWFFRPHETYHIASRKFFKQEVFKSDFYSSGLLSSVMGKCYVLFVKEYVKFFPQGFSEEDVYVCESRYMHKAKSIKRIKFWNVQENSYIKLLPRSSQCSLIKVPSVFASDGESLLKQSDKDKVQSHADETLDETKGSASMEGDSEANSSGDSLETSFFRELKDVKASVTNPEENCTYYEQYCIDEKVFKLGDFVYVRSDQDLPFIARIDQMWTDSNDDPWFRGPWFLRVEEVQHLPSRMFYERELFMSNIQDSNPMRSIIRKCGVLYPSDYTKWRPAEIPEADVYICESRYNEEEKLVKKMRMLKHFDLSSSVLHDEKYYLSEDVFLWKCHSPKLYPTIPAVIPVATPPAPPPPAPTPPVSSTPPVVPIPQIKTPVIAVPTPGGHVTLSLQQLQSLLAVNQAKALHQQPATTTLAYPCMWNGCQESFDDTAELGSHIIRSNHISPEPDGNYYCYWSNCPRNKSQAKPFDSLQKITRHVKEVHLLRIHTQQAPVLKSLPRSTISTPLLKDSVTTSTQALQPSIPITPVNVTPINAATQITPFHESVSSTPQNNIITTPVPVTPTLMITPQQTTTVTSTGTTDAVVQADPQSDSPPSIFVAPPTKKKPIYHSKLYLNHIERMRNNESTISPMPPARPLPLSTSQEIISQWIDPSAIPQGLTPTEALHKLYYHMISDSININNWLDNVQ